jgi:hypothetical protein
MLFIGIDPGLTGGIVAINAVGELHFAHAMPCLGDAVDCAEFARLLRVARLERCLAVLESVHSMPKQGVASSFKFGRVFGMVEGVVAALGIPYLLVTPQRWQKVMHAGCHHDDPKERSRVAAARLFPQIDLRIGRARKPHTGLIDALLLAAYGLKTTT